MCFQVILFLVVALMSQHLNANAAMVAVFGAAQHLSWVQLRAQCRHGTAAAPLQLAMVHLLLFLPVLLLLSLNIDMISRALGCALTQTLAGLPCESLTHH